MDATAVAPTAAARKPSAAPASREVWHAPLVRGDSTVSARDSTYWLSVASSSSSAASSAAWSFASVPLLSSEIQSTPAASAHVDSVPAPTATLSSASAPVDTRTPAVRPAPIGTRPPGASVTTRFHVSTSPLKCGDAGAYVSPFQLAFSAAAPPSPVVTAQLDVALVQASPAPAAVAVPEPVHRLETIGALPPLRAQPACHDASVAVEEVFENQRYQMVLGWGSKGHLLPLDPGKYMRAIRRPRRKPRCRRSSLGDYTLRRTHYGETGGERHSDPSSDDLDTFGLDASGDAVGETDALEDASGDDVDIEWLHSPVFPDIALPACADRARRWEWISPWHLEFPASSTSPDEPPVDPDGWQYATSFQHFPLARSPTAAARGATELLKQPVPPSLLVSPTWRPKHYVRCRKWVRYRRLYDAGDVTTSASAFDDAFLDSMRGWLRKLGHVRKNWKARYFVLERSVLRYYADASLTRLKGEVLLFHPATRVHYVDIHVAGGRDCAFAVHVGKDYALLLQAAELSDRESWMYCIEDALLCRDSYRQHPSDASGDASAMRVDVRESVALRRKLSSEAMVFNTSATTNLVALVDSQALLQRAVQRTSVVRQVLVECDAFVASPSLQQLASAFVAKFKQKYAATGDSSRRRRSRGASGADAQQLLAPSGTRASESSSDAAPTVAALQDARSLLALKSYRFFLERSLATVLSHLATLPCVTGSPVTSPRGYRPTAPASASPSPPRVSEDEWQLVRKAALYKLERLTFIPLQDVLYDLVESTLCPRELAAFERSRAHVCSQEQASLEIRATHVSPSHWRSATALLDTVDNYSLPCEKASVLLAVARCIYETHASEHGATADGAATMAADDFLPIFIYVLARCRLRNVVVTRHLISETMVSALMVGETGYYATMLEAAVGYIASIDADARSAS